jgi:hypothetical protein
VGLAGLAVLSAIACLALSPMANHARTDDAPIVVVDLMLFGLAVLALIACAAVFAGLLLGAAVVGLWHHWRPARGEQPEPPWPPPSGPADPTDIGGPGAGPDRDQHPVAH